MIYVAPFAILYSLYVMWVLYLAVMNLQRVYLAGGLNKYVYALAVPMVIAAFTLDILLNVFIASFVFWQRPHYKRLTMSARMDDLIVNGDGWRKNRALFTVAYLLQPFDTSGQHTTYGQQA